MPVPNSSISCRHPGKRLRRITSVLGVLLLPVFFTSCAEDVASRYYASQTYPAKQPNEVQLLTRAPGRPYTAIADFQSRNESAQSMRKRAAKIGADALIVTPLGGYRELGEEWAGRDAQANTFSRMVGTAIKYNP